MQSSLNMDEGSANDQLVAAGGQQGHADLLNLKILIGFLLKISL